LQHLGSENGQISVHISSSSQEALSNVTAAFISRQHRNRRRLRPARPAPGGITAFASGSRREFVYGLAFSVSTVTFRFQGRGVRPSHEGVNTATIECTGSVGGGGQPADLGIDANELRLAADRDQNFSQDSCAVFEAASTAPGGASCALPAP
jgi:hypothetical protein